MSNVIRWLRVAAALSTAAALSACAPSSYLVKKPSPSSLAGAAPVAAPAPAAWVIDDQRRGAERDFSTGVLPAGLRTDAGPIQPVPFLAEHLQAELASRGLPVQVRSAGADAAAPNLFLQTFRMQNHRSNGFAPFVTFTYLSADIDTPAGKKRVAAFVKRGKVPVWSFEEVIEPTLSQPLGLAVKELATKIAAQAYGWRASDAQLNTLLARLAPPAKLEGDAHLDVYALGFTNHPGAKERLLQLAQHPDEYVRLAAISSLGTLGAKDQFGWLKNLYERRDAIWQDRAMALKSIGDLGTPEARALLTGELQRWESAKTDKESLWTAQVIRLYL